MKKKLHIYAVHYSVRAAVYKRCVPVNELGQWRPVHHRHEGALPGGGDGAMVLWHHMVVLWYYCLGCMVTVWLVRGRVTTGAGRTECGHCTAAPPSPSENWRPSLCSVFPLRAAARAPLARPQLPARRRGLTSRRPRPRH